MQTLFLGCTKDVRRDATFVHSRHNFIVQYDGAGIARRRIALYSTMQISISNLKTVTAVYSTIRSK